MNGAELLLRSLAGAGVEVCFANPGTSEMQLVAALDQVPEVCGVLTLFEGVATGAADGYGRMAGRPAATLLHLGPGLANGLANLHNARRAHTPLVNVVGDHATYHARYDAPLQSDIESLARPVSAWLRRPARAQDLGSDAVAAVAAARRPPGGVATLVVPADLTWSEADAAPSPPLPLRPPAPVSTETVEAAARALRSDTPVGLLLGGPALGARGLAAAGRIAATPALGKNPGRDPGNRGPGGVRLLAETFPARLRRGNGIPAPERLGYFAEMVEPQLAGLHTLVLVGARSPVAFFAYPGRPSDLVPPGCQVLTLAEEGDEAAGALEALADAIGAPATVPAPTDGPPPERPERPQGALTAETLAAAVGWLLPEEAVVVDESNTAGIFLAGATAGAPPHDWLTLTGGAIGQGLPLATGAAMAAPGRPVLCLEADGSALYTIQALWTQARQQLDVTTVVLGNRAYAILQLELARVGAQGEGKLAQRMLDLTGPDLDFVALARGLGVPATRAATTDELADQLAAGLAAPGPTLIEAVLDSG